MGRARSRRRRGKSGGVGNTSSAGSSKGGGTSAGSSRGGGTGGSSRRGTRGSSWNKGRGRGGRNRAPQIDWNQFSVGNTYGGGTPSWNKGFSNPSFNAGSLRTIGNRANFADNTTSMQQYDPNSIDDFTTNSMLAQGAARDDVQLADFLSAQSRLSQQMAERESDVAQQQSSYDDLLTTLGTQGRKYSSELDRIKPLGRYFSSELSRTKGFGKRYSDELNRLKSFDNTFQRNIKTVTEGRNLFRSQDASSGDQARRAAVGREWDSTLKGLEDQYRTYKKHRGNVQSGQSRFKSYSDALGGASRDYQSYLGQLQSGQSSLGDYTSQIQKERDALADYASAFSAARQQSAEDAKSYTIRSQQGIAQSMKEGVTGIRSESGYTSPTKDRSKSTKRRFNRDFRIGSFGNTGQAQLNI